MAPFSNVLAKASRDNAMCSHGMMIGRTRRGWVAWALLLGVTAVPVRAQTPDPHGPDAHGPGGPSAGEPVPEGGHHAGPVPASPSGLQIPAGQEGSGTGWLPASSPMLGHGLERGPWRVMLHYNAFAGINRSGSRQGGTEGVTVNWLMGMAQRDLGGGSLSLRSMISLEPLLLKREGYPLLLQTGETAGGEPLVDRQHPHELFMEIGLRYRRPLTPQLGLEVYAAASGEPALGPVAFPHRPSAADDPFAPLSHHWLDSTHISFGVVTLGLFTSRIKVEGSWFNGREPDEHRNDFDLRTPDSYAGRVTLNPSADWSLQASYGRLNEPEALEPGVDVQRLTASAIYNRRLSGGNWASTLAWGRNEAEGDAAGDAVLLESTVSFSRNAVFARIEYVRKSGHDFALGGGLDHETLPVRGLSAGYSRQVFNSARTVVAVGGRAFVGIVNDLLEEHRYGTGTPASGSIFIQIRPAEAHHAH